MTFLIEIVLFSSTLPLFASTHNPLECLAKNLADQLPSIQDHVRNELLDSSRCHFGLL